MPAALDISPRSTMQEILQAFPGARRALFRRYHIGGCASCAFQPAETLEQVCQRNNNLDVEQVLQHIRTSHEHDARILLEPGELARLIHEGGPSKLLDVRSREEHEAVRLTGSVLMSQSTVQEIMAHWPRTQPLVLIDHRGEHGLDAAAYFLGHGFENVRCLRGGIDAWAAEVDPAMPRYRVEKSPPAT